MSELTCDMSEECSAPVSMIGDSGFIYCERHGQAARGSGTYRRRVRKLRPAELRRLERGEQLAKY